MIHRDDYWRHAQEAAQYLAARGMAPVDVVLQCGSGMSQIAELLAPEGERCPIGDIPHLPAVNVPGHGREAVHAQVGTARLLILTGRLHLYEGHSPEVAGFPAALAKACGAKLLIACNAAGALNQHMCRGDLMVHSDMINFQGDNALAHIQTDDAAERFPDPKPAYNPAASAALARHLSASGLNVHEGVFIAVRGPLFETRAELYMLRSLGADAVAMSIAPELAVCHFLKVPLVGVSVITNECFAPGAVTHQEVLEASQLRIPALAAGIRSFLEQPG